MENYLDSLSLADIIMWILVIVACGYLAVRGWIKRRKKDRQSFKLKKWMNTPGPIMTVTQVEDLLCSCGERMARNDMNRWDHRFLYDAMPLGRANAFLQYFGYGTANTKAYYFSAIPSSENRELREYGFLLSSRGIHISLQSEDGETVNIEIPFDRLKSCRQDPKGLMLEIVSTDEPLHLESIIIERQNTTISLETIDKVCGEILREKYNFALLHNTIIAARGNINPEKKLDRFLKQKGIASDASAVGMLHCQTKYCATAGESVEAALNEAEGFEGIDGTAFIEVPQDQYYDALKYMQDQINAGNIDGVDPGTDAHQFIGQGAVTFEQTHNIAEAGTIEGLMVDAGDAVVAGAEIAGIMGAISFGMAVWSGSSIKDAAKVSMSAGAKTLGYATAINLLTMGLTDETQTVELFGVEELPVSELTTGGLVAGLMFGPDIYRTIAGKISVKQLIKNSAVGFSRIVGHACGNFVLPGVGGIAAGIASGQLVRNILGKYIEDDDIRMYEIFKEEFLDIVSLTMLNEDELTELCYQTIASKKIKRILRDMYGSEDRKIFARVYINRQIVTIISKRQKITQKMITEGYNEVTGASGYALSS